MRTIVFHYHLFKNAGTSLDSILKKNFDDRWVTAEFPVAGNNNTALVEDWIRSTPDAVAYSSHTALGPLPDVEGAHIIPIMLLRDPIERIKSAYRFERKQQANTWGAQLAKEHDFEGYVRARLARPGDRQCRNFQTFRLASMIPGEGSELDKAKEAITLMKKQGVLGQVEDFDGAIAELAQHVSSEFPEFDWQTTKANVSSSTEKGATQNASFDRLLFAENADDIALKKSVSDV